MIILSHYQKEVHGENGHSIINKKREYVTISYLLLFIT